MNLSGYRPRNEFLQRQIDARWRRWVTMTLLWATAAALLLAAFAGPRQTAIRLRYEFAKLSQEVERLEREHRRLELERERLTSPNLLDQELGALGLERVPGDRVAFLAEDGRLHWRPSAGAQAIAARGGAHP